MKFSIDDKEVLTLTDTQKKVICNDICSDCFEDDMARRICWLLKEEKYQKSFERLKKEWEPKLIASGAQSLPTDQDAFAELVFAHPEYKDKKDRVADGDRLGK